nr:PREDICTED: neural proliferation differentiation and control protein 1 [Bos mutus]
MRGRQGLPRTMAGAGLASSGVGAGWPRQHHFWAGAESGPLRCFSSSASFPDTAACPGSLDCALKRRARCPPGAHVCGPCLQPFQEDRQGLCVPRMRQPLGEGLHQPRLEEEIDFLAQELARQEAGRPRLKAPPQLEAQQRPPEAAATLGLSERGQGLDLGLPSTRGAPAPTPRPSLGPAVSSGPVHMSPLEPRGGHGDGLTLGRHKEPPKELDSASSDEENEDGDFTVYECPGLAPTGEMEVRNPLFDHASLSAPPLQ